MDQQSQMLYGAPYCSAGNSSAGGPFVGYPPMFVPGYHPLYNMELKSDNLRKGKWTVHQFALLYCNALSDFAYILFVDGRRTVYTKNHRIV